MPLRLLNTRVSSELYLNENVFHKFYALQVNTNKLKLLRLQAMRIIKYSIISLLFLILFSNFGCYGDAISYFCTCLCFDQ